MNHRNVSKWFHLLERRSQLFIASACKPLGINAYEYNLMVALYEHEGVTQEEMAAILLVDKAVVARASAALETKGFLLRLRGRSDKRVKKLYSTEWGKAQEAALLAVLQRWIDYLSEGMEEKTVRTILDGLQTLSERAAQADFSEIGQ